MKILAWPKSENRQTNPYNYLLYSEIEKRGVRVDEFRYRRLFQEKYDYLHVHWPEGMVNERKIVRGLGLLAKLLFMLLTAKLRGTRIIWTAHNLKAHEENPSLRRVYDVLFPRFVDYVHCLSGYTQRAILGDSRYSSAKVFVLHHGHYRPLYPQQLPAEEARRRLGVPEGARVLLFFGQIRPYKNLETLVRVFRELAETEEDLFLLVAGRPRYDLDRGILDHPRIRADLKLIEDAEVPVYFSAASCVIAPYLDVTNSGTALLALSFCQPFVGPDLAAIRDLREAVGADWVRTYEGDLTAQKLRALVREPGQQECLDLSSFDWPYIAEAFLGMLKQPETAGQVAGRFL